jgi:hypothetical protein
LRHRILSPARLPFRHSRVSPNLLTNKDFLKPSLRRHAHPGRSSAHLLPTLTGFPD